MPGEQSILKRFEYSHGEWLLVKILTGGLWLLVMARVALLNKYQGQPFPEGITRCFNCSVLVESPWSYIVMAVAAVLVVLYISEKYMLPALIGIALISVSVLSVERSHGVYSRDELWSMLFIAQAIAYARYTWAKNEFKQTTTPFNVAMFYSIQMIAAAYVMTGLTKVLTSGFDWVAHSPNIALQVNKIFQQLEIEFGWVSDNFYHRMVLSIIHDYPNFIRLLFVGAVAIELGAFLALFSRSAAKKYGYVLLLLHLGILMMVAIVIPVYIFCIMTYLIGWPKIFERMMARGPAERADG
jgi:hypothetical protein